VMSTVSDEEMSMTELESALASENCVVSVMGAHAGEAADLIFERKKIDIAETGISLWLVRSPRARPADVQEMFSTAPGYTIFVEPSTKGGARPTMEAAPAKEYSRDRVVWQSLPFGLGPVTGKLDSCATALVFDTLTTNVRGVLDLWEYSEYQSKQKPLKFILGCSTVCAVRKDSKAHPDRMKSRYRGIIAVARMKEPYCVWVK
jgi:hypothetical protein